MDCVTKFRCGGMVKAGRRKPVRPDAKWILVGDTPDADRHGFGGIGYKSVEPWAAKMEQIIGEKVGATTVVECVPSEPFFAHSCANNCAISFLYPKLDGKNIVALGNDVRFHVLHYRWGKGSFTVRKLNSAPPSVVNPYISYSELARAIMAPVPDFNLFDEEEYFLYFKEAVDNIKR